MVNGLYFKNSNVYQIEIYFEKEKKKLSKRIIKTIEEIKIN